MDSIIDDAMEEADDDPEESPVEGNDEPTDTAAEEPATSGQMTDEELADVVEDLETKITVVGAGGAGGNTVTRMMEEGIHGAKLVAANTDAQHLADEVKADTKILIGKKDCWKFSMRSCPSYSPVDSCCRGHQRLSRRTVMRE